MIPVSDMTEGIPISDMTEGSQLKPGSRMLPTSVSATTLVVGHS